MGIETPSPPPERPPERVEPAVDGHFAGRLTPDLKHELEGWVILPVAALALAGFMALLLALLRVPGVDAIIPGSTQAFFEKGLVAHVTFAFVVWYLGVQGALTVVVTSTLPAPSVAGAFIGRVGLYAAALSFVLILAPALLNLGEASPNNYVPTLLHPLFFAGLALLAVGLALPILRLLAGIVGQRSTEPVTFGVAAAGVIFLIGVVCAIAAWLVLDPGTDPKDASEYVFWGAGHVLQFANSLLLLCGLFAVARIAVGETPLANVGFRIISVLLVAGASVGPLLYVAYEAGDPAQVTAFTDLYWYALPVPLGAGLLATAWLLIRRGSSWRAQSPEWIGCAVALVLFAFGGLIGFFESSVDTRTPAHYHAELIGVTLVFMCLYFALFLPLLGRPAPGKAWRTAGYCLLGLGQLLHSGGLFMAGLSGVARKVSGAEQGLESAGEIGAMVAMGLGGLIAVAGGVIFVVLALRSLLVKLPPIEDAADGGVAASPA